MTTLMAKTAYMAEVVFIQEPAVRWVVDVRRANLAQQDIGVKHNRRSCMGGRSDGDQVGGREGVLGLGSTGESSSRNGHRHRERRFGGWQIGIRCDNLYVTFIIFIT
jgi:hypothetical protein